MQNRPIQILLIETDSSLFIPLQNILQAKSALRLFSVDAVANLAEAFRESLKNAPDIIFMDLNPREDPDLSTLSRLVDHVPHIPIVVLLSDENINLALKIMQKGASDYLLQSQINTETLSSFVLRLIERCAAQKAIKESEERFRLMIENASDVILMLDWAGVITYAGPSTDRILSHRPSDITGRNILDFIHRDDRRSFLDPFEKAFDTDGALPFTQFRFRCPADRWLHLEGKGRVTMDASGRKVCILNSQDVSHRVKLEEELRTLALRDELTGLHNRRAFITCLDQQLKLVQRTEKKIVYLLFIDLDDFKWINDNMGHKEGDRVLIEAARILKVKFRDADIVARLGGDEFVVFLTNDLEGAHVEVLKKRLLEGVEEWNQKEERPYRLSMSVGIIQRDFSERRTTAELLIEADHLMYEQKREKKRRNHPKPQVENSPVESIQN